MLILNLTPSIPLSARSERKANCPLSQYFSIKKQTKKISASPVKTIDKAPPVYYNQVELIIIKNSLLSEALI
jgi:hypothetical protein